MSCTRISYIMRVSSILGYVILQLARSSFLCNQLSMYYLCSLGYVLLCMHAYSINKVCHKAFYGVFVFLFEPL